MTDKLRYLKLDKIIHSAPLKEIYTKNRIKYRNYVAHTFIKIFNVLIHCQAEH